MTRALRVVIYGSRPDGHAKVLVDLLDGSRDLTVVGLVDDYEENRDRRIRGLEVLGTGDALAALRSSGVEGVILGFGEAAGRIDVIERIKALGLALPAFVHESAQISASAVIDDGCQVLVGACIGPDVHLAEGVLVNTRAVLEHDVSVARGSVIAPNAVIAGRVTIEASATIGVGATILADVVVGEAAVVPAGAVVTRHVGPRELAG